MSKIIERTLTTVVVLLLSTVFVNAQGETQNITLTLKPSQPVEQRVADEYKAKDLRKAEDEKRSAAAAALAAEQNPGALLARARTLFVESETSYLKPVLLQNQLRKRDGFPPLGLAIVDGFEHRNTADIIITIDKQIERTQRLPANLAVVTLRARTNRIDSLRPLVPEVLRVLKDIRPGTFVRVGA